MHISDAKMLLSLRGFWCHKNPDAQSGAREARRMTYISRLRHRIASLLSLTLIFTGAYLLSFLLRFEFQLSPAEIRTVASTIGLVVFVKLLVCLYFGIHESWGRFVNFYDLVRILQAATVASAIIVMIDRIALPARLIPRSIFVLDWCITLLVLGGTRAVSRMVHELSLIHI